MLPAALLEQVSSLLALEEGFGAGQVVARKLRIQYPGEIYQVMNRRDQWEDVFRDEQDYVDPMPGDENVLTD